MSEEPRRWARQRATLALSEGSSGGQFLHNLAGGDHLAGAGKMIGYALSACPLRRRLSV